MSSRDVWPRRLIEAADRLVWRDPSRARQLARRGVGMLPEKREKAELWLIAGTAASELGEYDDAMECMERAGRLASEAEDQALRAEAHLRKAGVNYERGRYKAAKELLTRSLRLAMPLGDRRLIGRVFLTAGFLADKEGTVDVAKMLYDLTLRILPRGSRRERASTFLALAEWNEAGGDLRSAREILKKATALLGPCQSTALGKVLWYWGDLAFRMADHEDARRRYEQALLYIAPNPIDQSLLRADLAEAHLELGEVEGAFKRLAEVFDLVAHGGEQDTRAVTRFLDVLRKARGLRSALLPSVLAEAEKTLAQGRAS